MYVGQRSILYDTRVKQESRDWSGSAAAQSAGPSTAQLEISSFSPCPSLSPSVPAQA